MNYRRKNIKLKVSLNFKICKSSFEKGNEMNDLIDNFKNYFEETSCFLLPHPGSKITKKEFNGNLNGNLKIELFKIKKIKFIFP